MVSARRRGAIGLLEAIAHLERGLGLLHSLPESPVERKRNRAATGIGALSFTAKGAVAAKLLICGDELAESSGAPQQRFEALYGVWQ